MSIPKRADKCAEALNLTAANQTFEAAKQDRTQAILHARAIGLTYAEIGSCIAMTEDGVRSMLKRAGTTTEANNA